MKTAPPRYAPSNVEVDGAAIREQRKLAGLTLTMLSARAELTIGYLSQIERGAKPRVSPPAFHRIATALGLDPAKIRRIA